jgi:starch synthase
MGAQACMCISSVKNWPPWTAGGIKEVVVHQESGLLVALGLTCPENHEPQAPAALALNLAAAIQSLLSDPEKRRVMGEKARKRV